MKEHTVEPQLGPHEEIATFQSITRTFLSSRLRTQIRCPSCGASTDFRQGFEWHGPAHFSCGSCNRLIEKNLIMRALRDLASPK